MQSISLTNQAEIKITETYVRYEGRGVKHKSTQFPRVHQRARYLFNLKSETLKCSTILSFEAS